MTDDLRKYRRRIEALGPETIPPELPAVGASALVCRTVSQGSYPTVAGRYYSVEAVQVGGTETEGATPSFTTISAPFRAANLGNGVPPVGTIVLVVLAGNRQVFTYRA